MSRTSLSVVTDSVTARAPSKVNLHLGVGPRRDDGYHDLVTVFQALSLHDDIRVARANELSVTVRGEGAGSVPADASNLAARAAQALAGWADRAGYVAIGIEKTIPVAGGMAGGSADAAGALVALAHLWKLDISRDELAEIAAGLGSDVPFALHGNTALGTGRGEQLMQVLSRGEFHWVLALAREGLSTPAVYKELDRLRDTRSGDVDEEGDFLRSPDDLMQALASGDPRAVAPLLHNDLQPAALSLQPTLRRTLRAGVDAGALNGIVSGSGPTCAFLCADEQSAVNVAAELSGAGVARAVRTASGPAPGTRVLGTD
ncbi:MULTISPECIES: 4-(cytidine 5'-diphospho)-2-C-methyl-D-erythritol kinase [Gordonia]|uniref:4-diphosphocytidyl-2-C-methyl-D-erythritol kinase n=2 Tax=Gordonia alkanivorans TaxID=84096 RepID=F9VSX5_9ACTN|nr:MULTISPECIES: 4-(cytidine 5'-diphospho)-2-C-methyl-D-erythritol kinase [Gordonia]AZZ83114.1 4-(cytidine 5'-diphospho)-2-C-methyl-D-erythritol kinase [Gordonia alkanivorans]ETA08558.1 4-diphosphocytidyl-2C-methyl-D-erythritol kinase [Gordonia alkanivorans CGMCC 6845]MDH3005220.1 4-(cytidine 5'-diphospho)-2-C-methyl-D-erythritol kinase [Gordonia alkanivorans]MDH3010483.1 4-(cytidine 5'-diphospho)-2-C-methyl-D-erythritol kinase [Gordonia alkanivorans]MDH3014632.1 4-(cytidine 5'-diphospho)-2-C-